MRFDLLISTLLLLLAGCSSTEEKAPKPMHKAPVAKKVPKELSIHEHTRIDNYYWLNDRENPEVIQYLQAENAYTDSMLAHTKDFQEDLFGEITARIKKDEESVPYRLDNYYYYHRYEADQEYPLYCRKEGSLEANEEILLDVNKLAVGHEYISVGGLRPSTNHKMIVFGMDTVGRRNYTLHFKDLESGKILEESIPLTTGSSYWANNNKTVFYTTKDEKTLRSDKIWRHELGSDPANDTLVFLEEDETFSCYVEKSRSKQYIMVTSHSTLSTERRFLDANNPSAALQILQVREDDHEYMASHFGDHFYIITNWKAKNFRLMKTPVDKTEKENWEEVIAHRDDVLLESLAIFKDYLVLDERKEGLTQLRIISWEDNKEHYLDFGEETYAAGISTNPEFDSDLLRYSYSSLTTPNSIFDYHMGTQEKTLMKQQEVVGSFSPDNYETKRLHAKARDGTEVPISLVYRKGLQLDGDNPLLLYGYGSYGITIDPHFSSVRLSLLDRGFVFAIAHIRGSSTLGRAWYEDGKLLKKMNTFTDFIDCASYLVEQKYSKPEKTFAMGGSAGGLLVGAVANLAPDAFKGIVASVPFVDVLTTMLDETIPLTTSEYDEWGNPNNKEYHDYILSYSPYDQVKAQDYPAMLVTTGLHDSQVQYWEPAKWVAKLRSLKTDQNMLLLHIDMDTGHSGASGRFKRYREYAMEYAFILDLLGIHE